MRIGIIFHKDPFVPPTGIDLIRLRAIAGALIRRGVDAEIIAPAAREGFLDRDIPVLPLAVLSKGRKYDLVKTCYHFSIQLTGKYRGPLISRIVRVVDEQLPERDASMRRTLLECQRLIGKRAKALIVNNVENEERWLRLYGGKLSVAAIPNGCPVHIPPVRSNPYGTGAAPILFLGSLAAPRMIGLLNELALRLRDRCRIHIVGSNKAHLYGEGKPPELNPLIADHGELPEEEVWDYVRHARMGIALAAGPHLFDNDISKIYTYLRGGLPVLSEELIANNHLLAQTHLGNIFAYGNAADMAMKAAGLLERPPTQWIQSAMALMGREHSWEQRVTVLLSLIHRVLGNS
ncbi:MAG: hypothetical protein ABSG35_23700 [Syntrophobacteraceae bacterium]|jgi:hypothetical protein